MHSFIIQVSSEPINHDDYICEENISESDYGCLGIDYVQKTEADAMDVLEMYTLPKGFVLNRAQRTIEYDGSGDFFREYKNRVAAAHNKFQNDDMNSMARYELQEVLDYCFLNRLIFYEDYCKCPVDFLIDMNYCKKLYIGGCLDYHL